MHDIVHDFAQFLRKINDKRVRATHVVSKRSCQVCDPFLVSKAQEYRSLIWDEESFTNLCDCFTSLRVLKFRRIWNVSSHLMEKLIHLRWLDMSSTKLSKEGMESICKLYFLQTLLLVNCSIIGIPREIGNLVQLRNLDLSWNNELIELPESMCSLLQLQTLHIEQFNNFCRLPEGVSQLIGLRILTMFQGGSGWNKLGLLKKLNRLTGSLILVINMISSINDMEELVKDAREAELRNKEHLQTLKIQFWGGYEEQPSSLCVDVIESLEPNHNLKYLQINGYKGQRLPRWISSPLRLLKNIVLFAFNWLSSLPPMGKLPFLEVLEMSLLRELKVVRVEWLGIECSSSSSSATNVVVAFPKLKKLSFFGCRKWKEWEDITAEEEESAAFHILPSLTHLNINSCDSLKMCHIVSASVEYLQFTKAITILWRQGW